MDGRDKWLDEGIGNMLKSPVYAKANTTILKNMLPQKMSGVLLDFAKPLLDAVDMSDIKAARAAIMAATAVWNYSVLSDGGAPPDAAMDGIDIGSISKAVKNAFQGSHGEGLLAELLARKKALYPDNYRIIGNFDLNWDEARSEFHLTVLTN